MSSSEDIEKAISLFIKTFPQFKNINQVTISSLSNGVIFIDILEEIPELQISSGYLNRNAKTWVDKLSNLKRIIQDIEEYFEKNFNKGLKTSDLNLIDIAKENSRAQMLKFFEVIISVLLESPQKDEYIQKIMGLDEKSQSIFVSIIQNAMESRVCSLNQVQAQKMVVVMDNLSVQNNLLRQEIQNLYGANFDMQKQNKSLKLKVQELMEQLAAHNQHIETYQNRSNEETKTQNSYEKQQLRNMIANLKEKLMKTAVQNQMQISKIKEELLQSENRSRRADQLQQALEHYKQKYEETYKQLKKLQNSQKQRSLLQIKILDKQNTIKRLNSQKCDMEIQQTELRMQLEKSQVRFRQFQREVKNRLSAASNQSAISGVISGDWSGLQETLKALSIDDSIIVPSNKEKQLQMQQTRLTELEKQNRILMKKAENLQAAEQSKNNMQNAIKQLKKIRNQQMHVLLMTLLDYKQENERLNEEIGSKKKIK